MLGKKAVYKSFSDTKDVTAEIQAEEFLKTAPVKKEEYGHGYVPVFKGKHVIYGRYIFDRCLVKENGFSVRVYENDKGEREVLGAAIKNRTKNERITLTKYYLQYLINQFVLV